jgi:hypothetical protein
MVHVNWTFRTPMEQQNGPPGKLSLEWIRREISRCLPRQQQNWIQLEAKVRAILIQWERVPQAISYQNRCSASQQTVNRRTYKPPPARRIPQHNAETNGQVHLAGAALEPPELCECEAERWRNKCASPPTPASTPCASLSCRI